jgi:hypothetical protein
MAKPKEKTERGSNGVWLVTREHVSERGKTYKRRRKVGSPNRGNPIMGRQ